MKFFTTVLSVLIFSVFIFAQTAVQPLATANGRSFTIQDLTPEVAEAWTKLPETLAKAGNALLDQQIEDLLLEKEIALSKMSREKLLKREITEKVADPTEKEIKTLYENNLANLDYAPLEKVRPKIIRYLRQEPEKKVYSDYIESLKAKYKVTKGKDVNLKNLQSADVLATIGDEKITYEDFKQKNSLVLYEYEAGVFDQLKLSLDQVIDSALFAAEAQSLGISSSTYIAREITDKMRTFEDGEREKLESDLRKKLYEKYKVRYFVDEPTPYTQNVSVDDDPFQGKPDAPVTIVMFTDFQCPACSGFYPILKKTISQYGDKIRFVVRDFPLSNIHENAFEAAVAANAANKQGKFFEYKEMLYKNQNSLDTESLIKYAGELGLKVEDFRKDLRNEELIDEVRRDIADGKSYGVAGTPSVFINGYKLRNLSATELKAAIERNLD